MFGINGWEFLVLALVAAMVLGPERLPTYAEQLGRLVREGRRIARGAREQVASELGPDFDDVDWRKLDPRQYDPRRIVRDALRDEDDAPRRPSGATAAGRKPAARPGGPDGHATRPGDATPEDLPDYGDAT